MLRSKSHFHSMPGGEIDSEDVKKKIGDARAKLMQVRYCTVGMSLLTSSATNDLFVFAFLTDLC
jgi:hypothetical protein